MTNPLSKILGMVTICSISLFCLDSQGQTKTYRLLTKELNGTLWAMEIKDKKQLTVINRDGIGKETRTTTLPMINAGTKNAYYVWDKNMKQFLVVNFTDADRLLEVIADKEFKTTKEVTEFVADKRKLKAQKVYITIEGVTPKQAANMPAVTKIKPADIEFLKKAVAVRKEEIDDLFPSVNIMQKYPSMFMNADQWLNMQCLLRGYKSPQNLEEYEFLTTRIN